MTDNRRTGSPSTARSGIDLSGLPEELADALGRFMVDTDVLCAVGGEGGRDGRQADVVAAVLTRDGDRRRSAVRGPHTDSSAGAGAVGV